MNINVKDFGAKGDIKKRSCGSIQKDLNLLCVNNADFNQDDIGKTIIIIAQHHTVSDLRTKIKFVTNNQNVILESPATSGIENGALDIIWGTDDTSNVKSAINSAHPGDTVFFPPGVYCAHNLPLKSDISLVSLEGKVESKISNILDPTIPITLKGAILTQFPGDNSTFFFSDTNKVALTNVIFQGLTFDGNIGYNSKTCELFVLGNVDGHSSIRFLDCTVRNFSYGINTRKTKDHSSFEISNCKFIKNGGVSIGFRGTSDIKISDCKFIDCLTNIEVGPYIQGSTVQSCNRITIERCQFSGEMGYPIHFTGERDRLAATNVTIKECKVTGPDRAWIDCNKKGSSDQIALYGVDYFSITGNVSIKGGDGGIVIQECEHGIMSGNICNQNYGPGIIIEKGNFINIDANTCIKNCRRIKSEVVCGKEGDKTVTPVPGGIAVCGHDILISNNICCDDTVPSTDATQMYGLVISKFCKNIILGSSTAGSNFFASGLDPTSGGDIFVQAPAIYEIVESYDQYLEMIDALR
jgi:parallel beta-helix repeat protein